MTSGPLAAALAYLIWGMFPLYFRQIANVPALEIIYHRSWWSFAFMFALLAATRRLAWLRAIPAQRRLLALSACSALLLAANWTLYVWAVNADRVLDASLGYFINPLISVMLGTLVLHERPRPLQWAALALAGAGVAWLTIAAGTLPWVALVLALTFAVYGLLRKIAPLGAVEGLALETLLLAPLGLVAIALLAWRGEGHFSTAEPATAAWLVSTGPFTAVPLLLFAYGARRVTLATLGVLQYATPTIQFLLGVFVYHEPFSPERGTGFALIWAALAIYSAEGLWRLRRSASAY